jgi:hypothetical protein
MVDPSVQAGGRTGEMDSLWARNKFFSFRIQNGGEAGRRTTMKKMQFALAICALITGWCVVSSVANGLLSPHTPLILAPS